MNKKILAITSLLCSTIFASAEVKMLPLFTDNMVVQQQADVPFWGEAKPGKTVKLTASWSKEEYSTTADASTGAWRINVKTPVAGGPYTITISDGKKLTLSNVLVGEVWICSGQSNMEMQVEGWGRVNNYKQELADANNYPNIRLIQVKNDMSPNKRSKFETKNGEGWRVCSGAEVANFSACGYFFGREIHQTQNVPVGLIDTSWGGTIIEAWTSEEALKTVPEMANDLKILEGMPDTAEGRRAKYLKDIESWKQLIEDKDDGYNNGVASWASPDYVDRGWDSMHMPSIVQHNGLPGFNGIVWLRRTIDIPANWAGKELTLELGAIDDADFTYFNGVEVGHTDNWMAPRTYKIPASAVKAGKAVITIRLIDTGGDGGMTAGDSTVKLRLDNNNTIALAGDWKYKAAVNLRDLPQQPADASFNPNVPAFLYNAMLYPLAPFTIKGAIWYQGESNAPKAYMYRDLMPLMINDWRKLWGYNFPFYMVQLANFMSPQNGPEESAWAELREAQTRTLVLENTGMAVTIDIGEEKDIHPKNKQEVGHRLALQARQQTYGERIVAQGPMYAGHRIVGNEVHVFFRNGFNRNGTTMKTSDGGEIRGFEVAGVDHKFHTATARFDRRGIVVSCPEVPEPVAVRYGWANNPNCNLYNEAGLPAVPFRTDDWKGITRSSNY